jgi:hypothetical protein
MEGAENPWVYILTGPALAAVGLRLAIEAGNDIAFGVVFLAVGIVGLAMTVVGVVTAGVSGGLRRNEWYRRRQAHRDASAPPRDADE